MSAIKQAPQTGVPPMMSDNSQIDPISSEPEPTSVPSFMSNARPAGPIPEPVQLISANDLPDWIKQIAAEDEAKARAEAEAVTAVETVAESADPVAAIGRGQMPGETVVSGPSTSWLSKSAAPAESSDRWSATDAASTSWGAVESAGGPHPSYEQAAAPVFVPSPASAYSSAKPRKRFSMPARSKGTSQPSSRPIYRRQSVQLLALLGLLALLALMML